MNSSVPNLSNAMEVQLQNKRIVCDPAVTATTIAKTSVPAYLVIDQITKKEIKAEINCVEILKT